jgi:hypothetical protein
MFSLVLQLSAAYCDTLEFRKLKITLQISLSGVTPNVLIGGQSGPRRIQDCELEITA